MGIRIIFTRVVVIMRLTVIVIIGCVIIVIVSIGMANGGIIGLLANAAS